MKDRRKFKRAKKYFAINIVSVDTNGKHIRFDESEIHPKFYDESGIDFSPEGLKFICSKSLPHQSQLRMNLLILDEKELNSISACGTIKWFRQVKGSYKKYFQIGVCFKNLPNAEKKKLVKLWKKYK